MKILDKVEMIAKLKERIAEAQKTNQAMAAQLQKLLESILHSQPNKAI
ncbi:MAG: hypothetical protein GXO33_00870 [Epsilonproteobacteria bacterium]|nr:hypothetical protein [Campylobacterota bacterium]